MDSSSNGVTKKEIDVREKASKEGIENIADYELLALIFNTGTKEENVLKLSKRYLHEKGGLKNLFLGDVLLESKGVKKRKVFLILAIKEIYRRMLVTKGVLINNSVLAFEYCKNIFIGQKREKTVIFHLGRNKELLMLKKYDLGMESNSIFPIDRITKDAILLSSQFIIAMHNHPSKLCYPSRQDIHVTKILYNKLFSISILLLDSLVVTDEGYFSMRDEKISPFDS